MKKLTYSHMAAARLRANKRQYLSLALGIFLSIFLISSMVLGAYGVYLAAREKRYEKVGSVDVVILENDTFSEEEIRALDQYDRIGHAYVLGKVENCNLFVGYYDEIGASLLNLSPVSGRLPKNEGEIAMEASAMDVLENEWNLGDSVGLNICAIDGEPERRSYTLVGILPERSVHLEVIDHDGINSIPAIITSTQEKGFAVGRVGVNYVMGLRRGVSMAAAMDTMLKVWKDRFFTFYGLSNSGEQISYFSSSLGEMLDADSEMFQLIFMAGFLVSALVLSCAVGISGAMEGVLAKRQEEIGVLRALGATRRQIRRMFGRENLLLAAILAPASIMMSMGAVGVVSAIFPAEVKFGFTIWLLAPVLVFSVVVILLAGYLPLVRVSKLMPMSVIRDTAMLRRSKRIKAQRSFYAPKLISSRQVRFHPSRQIGASLLVGLMLLCSGLLSLMLSEYRSYTYTDQAAFELRNDRGFYSTEANIHTYEREGISNQSLVQLRGLDHVKSIRITRELPVTAILPQVPRYAVIASKDIQLGILNEEMAATAEKLRGGMLGNEGYIDKYWAQEREDYLKFLADYKIDGEAYGMSLQTVELTEENVQTLESTLASGKINVDAINAGQEVIVVAPEVWVKESGSGGYTMATSEKEAEKLAGTGEAVLLAWNDAFFVGQSLPLLQLYQTESDGQVYRNDATVAVGAVLRDIRVGWIHASDDAIILTTEQGLQNLNLRAEGVHEISVYLEGEITLEEEELLERQITAIARRTDGYSVSNRMEAFRESEREDRQTVLLMISISLIFFAVAVGMIVSSVTRQLQSEGRTIGMLRAVGADEQAILGCYSGQIKVSVGGGVVISLGLWLVYVLLSVIKMLKHQAFDDILEYYAPLVWTAAVTVVLAALCGLICRVLLRKRIREIVNKSIIENIKEL